MIYFFTVKDIANYWHKKLIFFMEGVLILRNSSRKLKTVVDNAILLNYAVSSENI